MASRAFDQPTIVAFVETSGAVRLRKTSARYLCSSLYARTSNCSKAFVSGNSALASHRSKRKLIAAGIATDGRKDHTGQASDMSDYRVKQLQELQDKFQIDGFLQLSPGGTGPPLVTMNHPNGSSVCIDLMGANLVSWKKPDGRELLYSSNVDDYGFMGGTLGRGGVILAFPQFGEGSLGRDGFLKDVEWELVGSELGEVDEEIGLDPAPGICMRARDTPQTRRKWPHSFEVEYQVNLMEMDDFPPDDLGPHFGDPLWDRKYENPNPYAPKPESEDPEASPGEIPDDDESHIWAPDEIQQQLRFMVLIKNTGDTPMKFTTGIRSLLAVKNLELYGEYVKLLGLGGTYALDFVNTSVPRLRVLQEDFVSFGASEIDSIAVDVYGDHDVLFCPGDRTHFSIHNREGFKDLAVWSPCHSMPFESQGFVGLGSSRFARAVVLQPGDEWYAESVFRSHDTYWDQLPCFMKNTRIMEGLKHPPHHIGPGED